MSLRAIAALTLLSLFVAGAAPARQADGLSAATVEPDVFVIITPSGFDPEEVEVVPGQTVHWTNESGAPQTVTADNTLFDSGPIPPGGGFSMTLDVAGTHGYSSSEAPGPRGSIQVVLEELPGPATDLVADHVPDIFFPPESEADLGENPESGMTMSRTRILVGFEPAATVEDANAALQAAGVQIVGAMADLGLLVVEAPDSADLSALNSAIDVLESHPSIDFAAPSPRLGLNALPRAAESLLHGNIAMGPWRWWALYDSTAGKPPRTPFGDGGNWGLEASRLPQAWSLNESIARKGNPAVDTGIIDAGYDTHNDLARLHLTAVCDDDILFPDCTPTNVVHSHGTHVAGTIGADFDNPDSVEANRSNGVSGVNPFARMRGVYWTFPGAADIMQVYDLVLDAAEDLTIPNLRVINYSVGLGITADVDSCRDDNDADGAPCEGENTGGGQNTCAILEKTTFDDGVANIDCNGGETNDSIQWWNAHPNPTCGPGDNDDGPAATQWCTPNNQDGWLKTAASVGEAARKVAERASALNVMIVQAAGNDSAKWCLPANTPAACTPEVIQAPNSAPFAWASAHWQNPALADPIMVVPAIGIWGGNASLARAAFSNIAPPGLTPAAASSYVSAPGAGIVSTYPANNFARSDGTSMAAPHVAGLIGYLLAYDPTLTIPQIRAAIRTWARADTSGNAAPRIDAFASLVSLPGAAQALVDVNDSSKDGNRRVTLEEGNIQGAHDTEFALDAPPAGGPLSKYRTAPNGKVDMRDFRRFRDAWLQTCTLEQPATDCPPTGDIKLDGGADHVKKDLNFDGCTFRVGTGGNPDPAGCATIGEPFARFDFNGDGFVSFNEDHLGNGVAVKMPLRSDGSPAAGASESAVMTDLDVLQSWWEANPEGTEGWTKFNLDFLMESGDLEIHADDFFAAGATEVDIDVRRIDTNTDQPARKLVPSDDFIVMTAPSTDLQINASATIDGELVESPTQFVTLAPGEDRRIDMCVLHVDLKATDDRLPANGAATTTITATLEDCDGNPLQEFIDFALEPNGAAHATLSPTSTVTDPNGRATTTLTAGNTPTTYTVTATVILDADHEAKGVIEITTLPTLTISYVWEQETVSWSESGDTRWGAIAGMPDCTTAGVEYCIDGFSIGPHPTLASLGLRREGQLSGSESAFFLTESVINSLNRSQSTWTLSDPDGSNVRSATEEAVWGVLASDAERYQNHALPATVEVEDRPEGILLRGLKAVGELGYTHSLSSSKSGEAVDPIELHATRGEFLLAPRGDGSALRFAVDLSRPIEFERQMDGNLKPYAFCGTFTKDLTTQPGYRVADTSEWVSGAVDLTRKTTFAPGDRPMPVGPGSVSVRYSFAATAASGATAPTPTLPDCSVNNPPDADFEYTPAAPKEGRVVRFFDRSTDPENNISKWNWTFGDGQTSNVQDPHLLYQDDGDYSVGLRVEDTEGAANGPETKLVSVANEPPEAGLDDAAGQVGTAIKTSFRLWDPARADQASIGYELKRTDTGAVIASSSASAGRYTLTFPAGFFASAGSYPFTLTATDKDGASASDTATITVTKDPPPPEEEPGPPTPTCDPTVTLDEQEQAFVQEVNDYRAENGLEPVVASPTLTKASERHVDDMVENDFLGHDGSDGSTPAQRAADAGYPSQSTGENLAFDFETAVDVLLGWKSSQTGHNENMLNPNWKVVGIARKEGPTTMPPDAPHDAWWWATLYGDVADCPAPTSLSTTTSLRSLRVDAQTEAAAAAGAGVVDADIEPEHSVKSPPPLEGTPPEEIRVEATPSSLSARSFAAVVTEPALAAFTVSDVTPEADVPVTLTNVSRDVAGDPIGGMLDIGNGPEAIAADGAVDITFPVGTFDVELAVPTSGGGVLAVTRAVTATGPPNLPPTATDDALTLPQGTISAVDVLANDTDPEGDPLAIDSWTHGVHGTVACAADCTYTHTGTAPGADTFTYTIRDAAGNIDTATVMVSVVATPTPPPGPAPAPQGPPPDTTAPVMRIATAPVTASKTGAVRVRLTCPPDESLCTGLLTLRSKSRLNVRGVLEARLAQVTFGRKAFTLQGGQTAPVTVKLSRKNRALLARLKKVRVLAIVEARDAAGNLRRTQATFLLRAPKRR
ncbi:MAG: PKD domain-containing protein [Gaiellales bacterium]